MPTAPEAETSQASKNDSLSEFNVSVDDFLNDTHSKAKSIEDFEPVPNDDTDRMVDNEPDGNFNDPVPAFSGDITPSMGVLAKPLMDESEAYKQTRTLMDMRETAQALAIGMIADGDLSEYQKYHYAPWQKDLLIDAWQPLVQASNIRVSPWIKVLYAEGISTGPLLNLAFKNRKLRLQLEVAQQRIQEMNKQAENGQINANKIPPPPSVQTRYDIKTLWQVDNNGYFEFDTNKVRIKLPDRKVKPVINEANYALLCKHNGKERIDVIFKTGAQYGV